MSSIWKQKILPIIMTLLFSIFFIPLSLILIVFSRFLNRELEKLIDRYGREDIVKIFLQGNIKGLLDLFIIRRKEKKALET